VNLRTASRQRTGCDDDALRQGAEFYPSGLSLAAVAAQAALLSNGVD